MQKLILAIFLGLTGYNFAQNVRLDWAKSAGNVPLQDFSYGLSVDDSGNVYNTGFYALTADLNTDIGVEEFTAMGSSDIFIHKVDNNGYFKWAKSIGGVSEDIGFGIITDSEGNVYVTGFFTGSVDFDPNDGVHIRTSVSSSRDIFVLKLDSLGNFIWANSFGGSSSDRGTSIALDEIGNVYITGFYSATADFDPSIGTFNLTSGVGLTFTC